MKGLVILGSTGSVGRQVLEVVRSFENKFHLIGLTAGNNHAELLDQVHEFNPPFAALNSEVGKQIGTASWITPDELVKKPEVDISEIFSVCLFFPNLKSINKMLIF